MTRKDYIAISSAIHSAVKEAIESNRYNDAAAIVTEDIVKRISRELQKDNPIFDQNRFRHAVFSGRYPEGNY